MAPLLSKEGGFRCFAEPREVVRMNYRILLPVTNNPGLVKDKLEEVDLTKLTLINNFDNPGVELLCKQAESKGTLVYRYPKNLGLAASWNVGLREVVNQNLDFVIILSVSAVFNKSINYFIDSIYDHMSKHGPMYRYLASGQATLHCFAHTRLCIDMGGYFDENFYPIYHEDTDFCYRSTLNGVNKKVKNLHLKNVVHSRAFSISMKDKRLFRLYQENAGRIGSYYQSKWGGVHRSEIYPYPFNNPSIKVNEWTVDPKIFEWPKGVYEGEF
jgi:glycosyltransferase involved in cell wall biosynthesis